MVMIVAMVLGCTSKSPYQEMLSEELASGVRNDSLFLDIHFGMGKKEFYTHCWDLNKQGLIRQGPNNLSVECRMDSTFDDTAFMRFYPQFVDNKISRMPIEFVYETFSPADPATGADSLLVEVKKLMEDWYDEGFIFMSDEEGSKNLWIKVDGNRQIRIFKKDVATVAVDIRDMSLVEEEKK